MTTTTRAEPSPRTVPTDPLGTDLTKTLKAAGRGRTDRPVSRPRRAAPARCLRWPSRAWRRSSTPTRRRGRVSARTPHTLSTWAAPEDHAAGNYWSDRFGNPEHRIDKVGVLVAQARIVRVQRTRS
jgi:hypothetical protein